MKTAVIYTRVSIDEKRKQGYSLSDQEEKLRAYCERKDIRVLGHYQDDQSAKSFEREDWKKLYAFLKANKSEIDYIFVVLWDRFSRNTGDAYDMLRQIQTMGIEVNAIEQWIDWKIPEQYYLLAMYITGAHVYNMRLSMRVKDGMRQAQKQGRWIGKAPFGYKNTLDHAGKKTIIPSEDASIVRELFEEFATGRYTAQQIRLKYKPKGLKITKSHFGEFLSNLAYIGKIVVLATDDEPTKIVDGLHEPIIDQTLFEKVQGVLIGRKKAEYLKSPNEKYPLRRFLRCHKCDGFMTGGKAHGHGGTYYYYRCDRCSINHNADKLNTKFVEYLGNFAVDPVVAEGFRMHLRDVFQQTEKLSAASLGKIDKQISEEEMKLLRIDESYMNKEIERDSYDRLKAASRIRKLTLIEQRTHFVTTPTDLKTKIDFGVEMIKNFPRYYQTSDLEARRALIGCIFSQSLYFDGKEYATKTMNPIFTLLSNKNKALQMQKSAGEGGFSDQSPCVNSSVPILNPADIIAGFNQLISIMPYFRILK